MHLAFDIGNSAAKGGLFTEGTLQRAFQFDLVPATASAADWKGALQQALPAKPDRAGLSSVVPSAAEHVQGVLRHVWGLDVLSIQADRGLQLPFALAYHSPATLGADRLAAAAAAWTHHGAANTRSVLALDAGTALTYEVVRARPSDRGVYEGGAIAPGPALARRALVEGTAQLPTVPFEVPPSPIGRSTTEALQSGLLYGFLDSADGMIRRLVDALGSPPPVVVCTGGWGAFLTERLACIDHHDPHLVLRGVEVLLQLNAAYPAKAEG